MTASLDYGWQAPAGRAMAEQAQRGLAGVSPRADVDSNRVRGGGNETMVRKLLIADDDNMVRRLLEVTLTSNDYQLLTARDGGEALALVRSERPDLVLLDVMMPGIDGLEVCRTIKADPELGKTPVVMLTARDHAVDRARGRAAGADEYLTKPFSPLQLIQLIEEKLGVQ